MLRSRIFWRLFVAYGVLLTVALVLVGWLIQRRVERHLVGAIRHELEVQTQLVHDLVAAQAAGERSRQVQHLAEMTRARVTLIAADGTVLADSAEDPAHMDNHLERPEVRQAQLNGSGSATRFSDTVHQNMMYTARRTDGEEVHFVRLALPLGVVEQELRWLQGVIWTATGLTLGGALLISWILFRRVSAPLVELSEAARSVAAGEYGKRVPPRTRDEVGTLAAAFNEMSSACALHIEQVDKERQRLLAIFRSMVEGVIVLDAEQHVEFFNDAAARLLGLPRETPSPRKLWELVRQRQLTDLVERIFAQDEPQHGELELRDAELKSLSVHGTRLPGRPVRGAVLVLHDTTHLRKLERVRQDFVANASHELKTPLAAIQATVETLQDGALRDPDHAGQFLERIRENAERLHRLVQDLLALSRVESGAGELDIGPVPVLPIVEGCLARAEARAVAKGLELQGVPPSESITVQGDEEALAEILDNVVDNAVKYTPPGGRITVRWRAEESVAVLEIEDTGIGIPEKDVPRIFERFYRVDKARSRELGGTGLGLSIVKHLVHALGGSVSVTSELGTGSVFAIRLPLAHMEAEREHITA
jgi:two-component system, OmpR family, phosphate regulon sensor histidine kinase PhoR